MAEKMEIYKCNKCGIIVEVLHEGNGELVCCGKPMEMLHEKTEDEGLEKHVPVIERKDDGIFVKVGSVEHPMQPDHHIEWIEIKADGATHRKFLTLDDKPEAFFAVSAKNVIAREVCNLHGLWKGTE